MEISDMIFYRILSLYIRVIPLIATFLLYLDLFNITEIPNLFE